MIAREMTIVRTGCAILWMVWNCCAYYCVRYCVYVSLTVCEWMSEWVCICVCIWWEKCVELNLKLLNAAHWHIICYVSHMYVICDFNFYSLISFSFPISFVWFSSILSLPQCFFCTPIWLTDTLMNKKNMPNHFKHLEMLDHFNCIFHFI